MKKTFLFIVFFFFAAFAYGYFYQIVWSFPRGVHCWAQSDRLSVAMNFWKRGMNLFAPSTLNNTTSDPIGMELPVQAFFSACLSSIFGHQYISIIYRFTGILTVFAGLIYLYRWVYEKTGRFMLSFLVPCFLFCSPIFVYTTSNYLADPVAFSLMFIAAYYTFRFVENVELKDAYRALWIGTLATLMKMSLGLFFIGLGLVHLGSRIFSSTDNQKKATDTEGKERFIFSIFKRKKGTIQYVLLGIVGISLIIGQYFYINQLNAKCPDCYFLSRPRPLPLLWDAIYNNTQEVLLYHTFGYFSCKEHWYFLFGAIGVALLGAFNNQIRKALADYYFLSAWLFVSAIALYLLFGKQFVVHNYYFIATCLPFCVSVALLAVFVLHSSLTNKFTAWVLTIALLYGLIHPWEEAKKTVYQHSYEAPYSEQESYGWLYDAQINWKTLAIPENEKVVCFNEKPTANLDLTYFNRIGMVTAINLKKEGQEKILKFKELGFNYFILSKKQQDQISTDQPALLKNIELVQQGNTFAVFKIF
ncbi:MAG: hypothetical protein RLZZ292_2935 [Bacteroidota bacterium]|jgi:hypothetical protein